MKKEFATLLLGGALLTSAGEVTGRCWFDRNSNGKPDADEPPLSGLLISDGISFAETNERGEYRLVPAPQAASIFVHRTKTWDAPVFFHSLRPQQNRYDFAMTVAARPFDPGALTVLQVADSETYYMAYLFPLRDYIRRHPEIDLVFHAGDITANNLAGLTSHRDRFTAREFSRPVAFVIGNHDILPRKPGEPDPYAETVAPWYYSFEIGEFLLVAAPMYHCFSPPLPYDMLDFGDYLRELVRRFPNRPKIMLSHDLVDITGDKVPTRSGDLDLDQAGFVGLLYGHKHMNSVMKYPSGRKAFCVSNPNFAGCGGFAPGFRVTTFRTDGTAISALHPLERTEYLEASSPRAGQLLRTPDGRLRVLALASNGGDEPAAIVARIGQQSAALTPVPGVPQAWEGALNAPDAGELELTATLDSGRTIQKRQPYHADGNSLIWATQLPGEGAFGGVRLSADGQTLYAPVIDDANAEHGGVAALDAVTGALRWFYRSGYSIRADLAVDEHNLYAIDTRGDIHAIRQTDGERVWVDQADRRFISPSSSGLVATRGVVVGGYGALLRGLDAATGKQLWRNTAWTERTPGIDPLTIQGDQVLIVSQLNGLFAHDLKTGTVRWRNSTPFLAAGACVDGNSLYIKGEHDLLQLRADNGQKIRSVRLGRLKTASTPVIAGDLVIFGSADGGVFARNRSDLSPAWQLPVGNAIYWTSYYARKPEQEVEATPLVSGENLLVGANDGVLRVVRAADGKVLRQFRFDVPLLTAPAVRDGRFYQLDAAGRVWCGLL